MRCSPPNRFIGHLFLSMEVLLKQITMIVTRICVAVNIWTSFALLIAVYILQAVQIISSFQAMPRLCVQAGSGLCVQSGFRLVSGWFQTVCSGCVLALFSLCSGRFRAVFRAVFALLHRTCNPWNSCAASLYLEIMPIPGFGTTTKWNSCI